MSKRYKKEISVLIAIARGWYLILLVSALCVVALVLSMLFT